MAIYHDLDNTGQEVQQRLDQVPVTQADLAQEVLDRQAAVGAVQNNVDAEELRAKAAEKLNADDIDAIEEKIPSGASSSNKLATESDISSLDAAIDAIEEKIPSGASSSNKLATASEISSLDAAIDAIEEKIPSGASSSNKMATASDISSLDAAIEAILLLIPSAATSLNKLADKAFVNSSIATATATFRGTKNLVSDLNLAVDATHEQIAVALSEAVSGADNNDYAFVQVPTSSGTPTEIRVTERYKFDGTTWSYEYDLNNSGFTADQWAAINSTITSGLVDKLNALQNNAPDEEDLTSVNVGGTDVLKFKDKAYSALTYSGMGRVYLRKNMVDGVNTLTQAMMSDSNTIYVIQYDYDLNKQTITVPENCILEFDGGSLDNGTLIGDNFRIVSESACLSNIIFSENYTGVVHSKWFVPIDKLSTQNNLVNCSSYLQNWASCGAKYLYLDAGVYYTENTIVFNKVVCIDGDGNKITSRMQWPSENLNQDFWHQDSYIFTDKEVPVINFVLTNESYQAFNIKNVGFANINTSPSTDYIPVVKLDITNSGLWGINFEAYIHGAAATSIVEGRSAFKHVGYQFNVHGNSSFMALSHFGGAVDKLNRAFEFNCDAPSAWNNLSIFDTMVTNCNQYVYAPTFLSYAVFKGQAQMNIPYADFFNNEAYCDVKGPVIWDVQAADYGGAEGRRSARYIVRSKEWIKPIVESPSAFVRTDGSPIGYNVGSGNYNDNIIKTNSLLYLLKTNNTVTLHNIAIKRDNVDYTSKFDINQVMNTACSDSEGNMISVNVAGNANTSFEVKIKVATINLLKNVKLFIISKQYINKRIDIDYYKADDTHLGNYNLSSTNRQVHLDTVTIIPTGTSYAIITYKADTYTFGLGPFSIPVIGIESNDTVNNYFSGIYNAPAVNRIISILPSSVSNDISYEVFNRDKMGSFASNDANSFVYLCTQRYYHQNFVSNSFNVILNGNGTTVNFEVSTFGQEQSGGPYISITGDSKTIPFDIAVIKNTTQTDNPFVEFDIFIKRGVQLMKFAIVNALQTVQYANLLSNVFIKTTKPTFSDISNAFYKHSIGTIATTANKPAYPLIGDKYFDTTLKKVVYYNGIDWVDALGNPVNTTYNTGDLSNYIQKSQTNGLLKNDGSVDITTYQEQVSGTAGNLAGFDANGKLADSGSKPSDFEPASA